jgi:hypothetical protein
MSVKTANTFVYGHFVWPGRKDQPLPRPGSEDIAVEILREYSSTELVGKLYERRAFSFSEWEPIAPASASSKAWYKWLSEASGSLSRRLYFAMDGSGYWEVVNFRNESDETGPYVAVALKYVAQNSVPKWVQAAYLPARRA